MNFPWVRHWQRYEYIIQKGYVEGKVVADIGCGIPFGSYAMIDPSPCPGRKTASAIFAVDLNVCHITNFVSPDLYIVRKNLYDFHIKVDVCVAVEVIEHMAEPYKFINHMASLCKNLFITTPLSDTTRKTRNSDHVSEYSARDFDAIINKRFEIVDKKYQLGDLSIVDKAKYSGDSMDANHVVQMVWCKRKNGKQ